jgi:hypothetical protein
MYNQQNQYNSYPQYTQMPARQRRPRSRALGCGCLLLALVALIAPFAGAALTTGRAQTIFLYIAGGIFALFLLLVLLGMLRTRSGREALSEGCADGCLEAIFSGLTGG